MYLTHDLVLAHIHVHAHCIGAENWDRVRAEWTKNAITGEDSVLNNDLDLSQIDVEQTMICLQTSKPFPQNVSLSTIVEILNVLWDDGGVQ